MTPLRQRFIEDMHLRGLAPTTQRSYIHYVADFARFYNTSPEKLDLEAVRQGKLRFPGEIESLQNALSFAERLMAEEGREWVVYAKPPFGGAQRALEYLGRYTHRVALSNERLLAVSNNEVTFQWKDYRHQQKQKSRVMTLEANEFIRRFLIHALPAGFQRIRHYGLLANRNRKEDLALCRTLLSHPITELLPATVPCLLLLEALTLQPPARCPKCRKGTMIRLGFLSAYLWPARPPDTS
jgi:hypothetical protein